MKTRTLTPEETLAFARDLVAQVRGVEVDWESIAQDFALVHGLDPEDFFEVLSQVVEGGDQ